MNTTVENQRFQTLDVGGRREAVNPRQRFDLFRGAKARADGCRGSMVFATVNGGDHLLRGSCDARTGRRRQTSHLPFRAEEMRSFARGVVAAAAPLFAGELGPEARFDG